MLTFVQKRGNATFYEWRTGNAPTVVERPVVEDAPLETVTEDTVSFSLYSLFDLFIPINSLCFAKQGFVY